MHFKLFSLLFSSNEAVQKRAFELLKKFTASLVQDLSVSLEFSSTNGNGMDDDKVCICDIDMHC